MQLSTEQKKKKNKGHLMPTYNYVRKEFEITTSVFIQVP